MDNALKEQLLNALMQKLSPQKNELAPLVPTAQYVPLSIQQKIYGYPIRKPYQSELDYFKGNTHVGGMAAQDNNIILNPYSPLTDQQKNAVAQNEAARLFMRQQKYNFDFEATPQQLAAFKGTSYGDPANSNDLKSTILGRAISGDPSAGQLTPRQQQWANFIKQQLAGRK